MTDYYRLEHPDVDPGAVPPLLFETMLSNVEANAKVVIDELLEHRDPAQVDPERMALFAWHLALTYTRGRAFREQVNSMTAHVVRMQWGQITDDGIREELGRLGIEVTEEVFASHRAFFDDLASGEVRAEQRDAALIARSAELAYPIGAEWFKRESGDLPDDAHSRDMR